MSSGTDWDTNAVEYSGDIAVSGDETPPVGIESPEDVYILPHSIEGDLKIVNAEYVFADVPTGDAVDDPAPETEITGSLEDAYYQPHGVAGDALLVNPEDVFIAQDAVEGQLQVVGDEQRFYDDQASPQFPYAQLDETLVGWEQSATVTDPRVGAAVSGYNSSLAIEEAEHDLDIYVLGSENEVRVTSQVGREMSVNAFFIGTNNTVSTGPYVNVTVANESGTDNTATQDSFPADRLIEQTETDAYSEAGFGRAQVTYQQPADTDDEYCPNCGCVDVTIIERRQRDALFAFGSPVYTYDDGGVSYECEECSPRGSPRVELTPDERREMFS